MEGLSGLSARLELIELSRGVLALLTILEASLFREDLLDVVAAVAFGRLPSADKLKLITVYR